MKEPKRSDVIRIFRNRKIYDDHLSANPRKNPVSKFIRHNNVVLGVKAVWRLALGKAGEELKFKPRVAISGLRKLGFDDFLSSKEADQSVREYYLVEEKKFWTRNSRFSKEVKKRAGYICECCNFDPDDAFQKGAKACLEAHHLDPFSFAKGSSKDVNLGDLVCLCANCHRVIHAMIRADNASITLLALRKNLSK